MSFDHGNARIAALRGRLLDRSTIARLAECATPSVFLTTLEHAQDWAAIVRGVLPLGVDPSVAADAAIERHRSARLGSLPRWYGGGARALVEALVLPLDAERVQALLRRRRGGAAADAVVATVVPGALVGARTLGAVARAPTAGRALAVLVVSGVLDASDLTDTLDRTDPSARSRSAPDAATAAEPPPATQEAWVAAAFDRARHRRASRRGADARRVQALLARERDERAAVDEALRTQGPAAASLLDGSLALGRLAAAAAAAYRDPLGVGAPIGYVAAVELQALRLRAALAQVRGGWRPEQLVAPLGRVGDRRWPASSS